MLFGWYISFSNIDPETALVLPISMLELPKVPEDGCPCRTKAVRAATPSVSGVADSDSGPATGSGSG